MNKSNQIVDFGYKNNSLLPGMKVLLLEFLDGDYFYDIRHKKAADQLVGRIGTIVNQTHIRFPEPAPDDCKGERGTCIYYAKVKVLDDPDGNY